VPAPAFLADTFATSVGRRRRHDPVAPNTGGPAGNARLTAWVGAVLLVLFAVEVITLLSLGQLITVHIAVGAMLVPLAMLKTATTGWRIVRYYTGNESYRVAGPPPLVLRVVGPFVILGAIAVLGTGLALIPLGQHAVTPFVSVAGFSVNAITLHKAAFVFWLAVTALHVLTRLVTALELVRPTPADTRVSGRRARLAVVSVATGVGLVAGLGVLHYSSAWTSHRVNAEVHQHHDG
jgi:hypothetical protein